MTRVGGNGQGLLLKLAINISLAVQTLAFSEGLLLAERGGIDPRLAARVMSESSIGSPMLQARVPLLLDLPESAWFDVQLMHKDIRLALEAAAEPGRHAPVRRNRGPHAGQGARARLRRARHRGAAPGPRPPQPDGDGRGRPADGRAGARQRDRARRWTARRRAATPKRGRPRSEKARTRDPRGGRRAAAAPRTRRGEHGRGGRNGRREQGHHLPLVAVEGDARARRAARLGGRQRAGARHRIAARRPARPRPAVGARDPATAVRARHRRPRHRGPVRPAVRRGLPHPLRRAAPRRRCAQRSRARSSAARRRRTSTSRSRST